MSFVQEIMQRDTPLPRTGRLTIVAQDPAVVDDSGALLTATVRVPADWLVAGPRSHRFHVVDYDVSAGVLRPPTVLAAPGSAAGEGGWELEDRFPSLVVAVDADEAHAFRVQNVYAVAARTLAQFEHALGRRLGWAFASHQLYLVPHAFLEANAYYSPEDKAVLFGYFPAPDGRTVYTCLSHDVVAHEVTHALLDGLRPRYQEPGLPDQAAFHEAFADIVALLSVLSMQPVVAQLLGPTFDDERISAEQVSAEALKQTALFQLARQMGEASRGHRGALRHSVALAPTGAWRTDAAFAEPHRRGEVLVAAVMQTMLQMWQERLVALINADALDRDRAAEEGAKSASHLLRMCIRAIDYTPPVELEFEDFVDAVLLADEVVAPDDDHGYRRSLTEAFAGFDIHTPQRRIIDLSSEAALEYHNVHFRSLAADTDEVFRFLWQNADVFDIDREHYLHVDTVKETTRVGPDGLVVQETVADYVQVLEGTGAELEALGLERPDDVDGDVLVRCWGGGAVVFDQFGRAKYHQSKPVAGPDGWPRQSRRLAWLAERGLRDRRRRYGFGDATPKGQRFAQLHDAADQAGESW
jgi:hypothetical protein